MILRRGNGAVVFQDIGVAKNVPVNVSRLLDYAGIRNCDNYSIFLVVEGMEQGE